MKKTFSLILVVVALLGLNTAAVSADSGPTVNPTVSVSGGVFVPLGHGVDH
ncbi:hypothetical protein [Paenibacillus sp. PK3_47]|uniref:hypothetical protein n=1 Tax=Paenibacillus sp. PK3_47 TaxID=2072642 RepID=UPI00201E3080|nr:hypothetical protein [Paenibacillus sp. PK3_47]